MWCVLQKCDLYNSHSEHFDHFLMKWNVICYVHIDHFCLNHFRGDACGIMVESPTCNSSDCFVLFSFGAKNLKWEGSSCCQAVQPRFYPFVWFISPSKWQDMAIMIIIGHCNCFFQTKTNKKKTVLNGNKKVLLQKLPQ